MLLLEFEIPMSLRRKMCEKYILPVMSYECETYITSKDTFYKMRVVQKGTERTILRITRKDRVKNTEVRGETRLKDIEKKSLRLAENLMRIDDEEDRGIETERWMRREG